MPYFTSPVDGARLHYADYGPADGPVVVFVHSAYFGTETWEFQMLPLAGSGYHCVGLDRRGHGRSEDVWGGFDLDTLADDLNGLLEHLDLREVTLIGHSPGSAEILRCLTRHGTGRWSWCRCNGPARARPRTGWWLRLPPGRIRGRIGVMGGAGCGTRSACGPASVLPFSDGPCVRAGGIEGA
ncbi:alpha/beta fold hydrolase [Streptomyces sp. NPDC004690]